MKKLKAHHDWIPKSITCPIYYPLVFYALILPGVYPSFFTPFRYFYVLIFYLNLWTGIVIRHSSFKFVHFLGGKTLLFYPILFNNWPFIPIFTYSDQFVHRFRRIRPLLITRKGCTVNFTKKSGRLIVDISYGYMIYEITNQ